MLHSQNIICISSIDWDFIWQGHQEIMSTFANNNNRVLFIENTGVRTPGFSDLPRLKERFINWRKGLGGIRQERENLYVFSPLIIPFPYSKIARWFNRRLLLSTLNRWIQAMDFNDAIIWAFLPTGLTLDLINSINKKLIIYYCIDNFAVSSSLAHKVKSTEQKLIKQSDLVFVTAKQLYDYCSQENPRVYLFPFGVNISCFEQVRMQRHPQFPAGLKGIKQPIVGYIGGVHKWLDQALIKEVAQIHPDYSFVFVGPVQTDISTLSDLKNVYFLGAKLHQEIPLYIDYFAVGIIPYLLTDYTQNVYPTKLNEYLALGKPVVSTDLLEINAFNQKWSGIVAVGKKPRLFGACLEEAINSSGDKQIIKRRIEIARQNTWQKKIEEMSQLVEGAIERRKRDNNLRWKENLLRFYRFSGKRLKLAAITCCLIYFILFHTSFLWLLARPLKILQPPKKANVIVVFAGGVGESGKAGQGYQERVVHAADLYKKGFSRKLIFSSGYVYALKEAEVMKTLAVSLGIPGKDIILEKDAGNTFENVKYTLEIMREQNWNSALVISSPYHMGRVNLVYRKAAPEIEATFTPVPTSIFFGNETVVTWSHIRAIAHEYAAIFYYWWKGYI